MNKTGISVRVMGDTSRIAEAMTEARISCVQREVEKQPPLEADLLLSMLRRRYSAGE